MSHDSKPSHANPTRWKRMSRSNMVHRSPGLLLRDCQQCKRRDISQQPQRQPGLKPALSQQKWGKSTKETFRCSSGRTAGTRTGTSCHLSSLHNNAVVTHGRTPQPRPHNRSCKISSYKYDERHTGHASSSLNSLAEASSSVSP